MDLSAWVVRHHATYYIRKYTFYNITGILL